MAFTGSYSTQVLIDGPRNAVVKFTAQITGGDLPQTSIILPSGLSPAPRALRVHHVDYSIQDGIEVILAWNATTDVPMLPLAGRGRMDFSDFGGLVNNAGAGKTGGIDISTVGWTSGTLAVTIVLEMWKDGVSYAVA